MTEEEMHRFGLFSCSKTDFLSGIFSCLHFIKKNGEICKLNLTAILSSSFQDWNLNARLLLKEHIYKIRLKAFIVLNRSRVGWSLTAWGLDGLIIQLSSQREAWSQYLQPAIFLSPKLHSLDTMIYPPEEICPPPKKKKEKEMLPQ